MALSKRAAHTHTHTQCHEQQCCAHTASQLARESFYVFGIPSKRDSPRLMSSSKRMRGTTKNMKVTLIIIIIINASKIFIYIPKNYIHHHIKNDCNLFMRIYTNIPSECRCIHFNLPVCCLLLSITKILINNNDI